MKITNTPYYSKKIGTLADGCRMCVKGEKLVLFVTGVCPRSCYYCPLSNHKYHKDVMYANERPIVSPADAIVEAKESGAKGAGVTGGDPLAKLDRTCSFMRALKKEFGKKFHIHLYTSLVLVNEQSMKKLYDAGLDEIRFHPEIGNELLWHRIDPATQYKWKRGIEIPIIPGKLEETKRLIDFFHDKVMFFNFNELEVADNDSCKLAELGFKTKAVESSAVRGSEVVAVALMKYIQKKKYNVSVHFCTSKLKDRIQMTNRIKKRALLAKKRYDIVDEDGLLYRGVIYFNGNLFVLRKKLMKEFEIPGELIEVDDSRKRLLTASWIVHELKTELKKKKLKIALVSEYPTWDRLTVSCEFL